MKALSVPMLAALALAGVLTACDAGPSAVAPGGGARSSSALPVTPVSTAPVPMINGRPMWAANRRHSAQDNAAYQFRRNGRDFNATSEQAYVAAAHAFIARPPAGVQTLTRSNGDRLIYDAASNTFAVATSDGAPRTMFKPRQGADYWRQQQDRANRTTARAGRSDRADSSEREG